MSGCGGSSNGGDSSNFEVAKEVVPGRTAESADQAFSDSVIGARYTQGQRYETEVKPYFEKADSIQDLRDSLDAWLITYQDMVIQLEEVDTESVDPVLVNTHREYIECSKQFILALEDETTVYNFASLQPYIESLDSKLFEFEGEVIERGLTLWAVGED